MQAVENRQNTTESAAHPSLLTKCIATVCFAGYSPVAPGTAGSLLALIPLILFPSIDFLTLFLLTLILFFLGVGVSRKYEKAYGKDPQVVVIDEFVGMWVTMLCVPITWVTVTLGFFLFRVFDVVKPPPARQIEALPHGWGIMLDDVVAGIYAGGILFFTKTLLL